MTFAFVLIFGKTSFPIINIKKQELIDGHFFFPHLSYFRVYFSDAEGRGSFPSNYVFELVQIGHDLQKRREQILIWWPRFN